MPRVIFLSNHFLVMKSVVLFFTTLVSGKVHLFIAIFDHCSLMAPVNGNH